MEYTQAERNDASRFAISLIGAMHDGDDALYEAILDEAGDQGRRAIAEALVHHGYEFTLRLMTAVSQMPDEEAREFVLTADLADFGGVPGLHAAVSTLLASVQVDLAAEA
jgi:hypothetical protein